jgi:hypothetical protein
MPLPKKLQKSINKFAKKDGKIAKKFYPFTDKAGDLKLYILKQNGRTRKFDLLGTIDKWSVQFSQYLDRHIFSVSTTAENFGVDEDETFYDAVMKSTHFAKNGELYRIREGDTVQIFGFRFGYKIRGELDGTFTLTDTDDE